MDYNGLQLTTMDYNGLQWTTMDYNGLQLTTMDYNNNNNNNNNLFPNQYIHCRLKNNSGQLVPWWVLNNFYVFTYSF